MRKIARFLVVLAVAAIAGVGPGSAQTLVGSLECVVAPEPLPVNSRQMRCVYWPWFSFLGTQVLTGTFLPQDVLAVARRLRLPNRRAVWSVYSLHPYSSIRGTYSRLNPATNYLTGGIATELHPLQDVPGEASGLNLAPSIRGLRLQ